MLVAILHQVHEESVTHMGPGDFIVLSETLELRKQVEADFFAILACPQCGNLDLITRPQFGGMETVICGHDNCSCHFRIIDEARLIFLPVN